MKIALISCSKTKQRYSCPAGEMYLPSKLFALSYKYAKKNADRIFILSAKYGLISDDTIIHPYDMALNPHDTMEYQVWIDRVIHELRKQADPERDEFIILAGKDYYQPFLKTLRHTSLPLLGKDFSTRIAWLEQYLRQANNSTPPIHQLNVSKKSAVVDSETTFELHRMLNQMPLYRGSDIGQIPVDNGIYLLFEKGEIFFGMHRVVRVGTHTSPNRLRGRLLDHFFHENKDGSIFRKNIGKALLNASNDSYLPTWSLNTSLPNNYKHINLKKQQAIEHKVTEIINDAFRIAVIPAENSSDRLRLEEGIIATLHQTKTFGPSDAWFGLNIPEPDIRSSGLWLKEGLGGIPLNDMELSFIKRNLLLL